jgi:hypothetical protein
MQRRLTNYAEAKSAYLGLAKQWHIIVLKQSLPVCVGAPLLQQGFFAP